MGFLDAQRRLAAKPKAHPLPSPLRPDSLERARMIGPGEMGPPGSGWAVDSHSPVGDFPALLASQTPGATQPVAFSGPILAMFYVLGPDTGAFDYQIDGGDWKVLDPFELFAKGYFRAHYRLLADGLADGPHTVTFKIRAGTQPGQQGHVDPARVPAGEPPMTGGWVVVSS